MDEGKKELVYKTNSLVEASYRLSLVEQQIVLFSIARGREKDALIDAATPITIEAREFAAMFGADPNGVYHQLKDAMDTLYERSVVIRETDKKTGKEKVTKSRWISTASYITGAGQIQIIFAPLILPFIARPEREFTRYEIEQIAGMSSVYAVRLYELLKQYLSIKQREISIAELRRMLELTDDEYQRIFDIKKWVIDVAVTQINKHTDINVSYENVKTGRSVTGLLFSIKERSKVEEKTGKKKADKEQKITRDYIEKNALPGESYDESYRRLLEQRGQQRLC